MKTFSNSSTNTGYDIVNKSKYQYVKNYEAPCPTQVQLMQTEVQTEPQQESEISTSSISTKKISKIDKWNKPVKKNIFSKMSKNDDEEVELAQTAPQNYNPLSRFAHDQEKRVPIQVVSRPQISVRATGPQGHWGPYGQNEFSQQQMSQQYSQTSNVYQNQLFSGNRTQQLGAQTPSTQYQQMDYSSQNINFQYSQNIFNENSQSLQHQQYSSNNQQRVNYDNFQELSYQNNNVYNSNQRSNYQQNPLQLLQPQMPNINAAPQKSSFQAVEYSNPAYDYELYEPLFTLFQPDLPTPSDSFVKQAQKPLDFNGQVLQMINDYFKTNFTQLKEAIVHYRKMSHNTRVQLNFKALGEMFSINYEGAYNKFLSLQQSYLDSWDQEEIKRIKEEVKRKWNLYKDIDKKDRIWRIRKEINEEMKLEEQFEKNYKQIANVVNYQLTILNK
ncbi:Hypothetical_protein [Hexamita inflata]|uniref:Hypothetical_protein n=1 Tax=Hexamita inflata TaxID=28002 RepID=A0AA86TB85_9EUKA|nr:Hypothetical protein HINF_LOCUS1724 [Hexamita inflata]